jgi:hypothetical protein
MTIERKILFGISDIRTISFACDKCGARATFPLGPTKEPTATCYVCQHPWRAGTKQHLSPFSGEPSAYAALLQALSDVKALEKEAGFKMLFELEEPSSARVVNDPV